MIKDKFTNQEWDKEDIVDSKHDQIVLKLMDKEILKKLFQYRIGTGEQVETVIEEIKTEVPVKAGYHKDFIVGYVDLVIHIVLRKNGEFLGSKNIYIEVKPKVDNFGSLIRQINKYREYVGCGDEWVVATRECSKQIERALNSQKIRVIIASKTAT